MLVALKQCKKLQNIIFDENYITDNHIVEFQRQFNDEVINNHRACKTLLMCLEKLRGAQGVALVKDLDLIITGMGGYTEESDCSDNVRLRRGRLQIC